MVECVVDMQCGDTIHAFAWGDLWATVSGDMASNVMYKTFHQSVNVMQSLTFCLIVCKFVCWAFDTLWINPVSRNRTYLNLL